MQLSSVMSIVVSSTALVGFYALVAGDYFFWDRRGVALISSVSQWAVLLLITAALSALYLKLKNRRIEFDPRAVAISLLILFFSDWLTRRYNLLQGPVIRGEILLGALLLYPALRIWGAKSFGFLLPLGLVVCVTSFLTTVGSSLIFSDDHPTFFYRLSLLKENFPNIPLYDALWNGGYDVTQLLSTGSHNVFLLAYPLIAFFPLEKSYTLIVAMLLFVLPAVSIFIAARYEKFSSWSAALAALLAISSSLFWFRWALKYGTLGFVTSAALFPLVFVLLLRALDTEQQFRKRDALLLAVSATLMLCWTPMALTFLPISVLLLRQWRELLKKRNFLYSLLAIFLINLPWVYTFIVDANVFKFINSEQQNITAQFPQLDQEVVNRGIAYRHKAEGLDLRGALNILRETAVTVNPVILLCFLPGVFLLAGVRRQAFLSTVLYLLVLGTVLVPLKPQLELDRMLVLLFLFASLPAALLIARLAEQVPLSGKRWFDEVPLAIVGGFVFAAIFSSSGVVKNRSLEQFDVMKPWVAELATSLKEAKTPGRVFFSGFVLHELNGGHLAPLTIWSRVPMIASSHIHSQWEYRSSVPKSFFDQGEAGIEHYFHLYNVSVTVAHEPFWIGYFHERKNIYQPIGVYGPFHLFHRTQLLPGYFIEGSGEIIEQRANGVDLKLTTENAAIRFSYNKRLEVKDAETGELQCQILPHKLAEELVFIELKGCPVNRKLTLSTPSLFRRFLR